MSITGVLDEDGDGEKSEKGSDKGTDLIYMSQTSGPNFKQYKWRLKSKFQGRVLDRIGTE